MPPLSIISWNVNGIRAVEKKGELKTFLNTYSPSILCLQETKAKPEQVDFLDKIFPEYVKYYFSAQKAGYSGTAIWIRKEMIKNNEAGISFHTGMPNFEDTEGRISRLDITINNTDLSILGVYFPNGGKSPEAWNGKNGKLDFYDLFLEYVTQLREEGKTVIFCGDVNCCHTSIDIARPKENDGNIGFHPEERRRISNWIENGWQDIWRSKNPDTIDQYSWWSYRGGARDRNVGWRIDYFFAEKAIVDTVTNIQYLNEQKGSDHCPILLETSI